MPRSAARSSSAIGTRLPRMIPCVSAPARMTVSTPRRRNTRTLSCANVGQSVDAAMRTLLIDNYDSFTFNLFHLLGEVNGDEPVVVRNDELSLDELAALAVDNIVISPGPGRPEHARDVGVSLDVLKRSELPVLGVCLGHQALAHISGGAVEHAPEVMHGRLSPIDHDGRGLFAGIPQGFAAVRYHSLVVGALPAELRVTAWTHDDIVMGIEHRTRPLWGVQFHPESISTEHGRTLLRNFRDLTRAQGPPAARGRRAARRARRRSARAPPHAGDLVRSRGGVRRPLRRARPRRLAGQLARGPGPGALLLHRRPGGPARPGRELRRRVAGRDRGPARTGAKSCTRASSTTAGASSRACSADAPELPFDFTCGFAGLLRLRAQGRPGRPSSCTARRCPTRSCSSATGSSPSTTTSSASTSSRSPTPAARPPPRPG